jgi:hypothetical protein
MSVSPSVSSSFDSYFVPKVLRKKSPELSSVRKESLVIPLVALPYFIYVLAKKVCSAVAGLLSPILSKNINVADPFDERISQSWPDPLDEVPALGVDFRQIMENYGPRHVIETKRASIAFY